MGTGVIMLIWALGAVITGLLAILTRKSRATKVVIPPPKPSTQNNATKKKCPMCAELVQPT